MVNKETLPALVVGAGPVGLTMALALTLSGIKCRIVDKSPQASDKSKALGIHARTLELLETLGVVDEFLKVGHKVHATNMFNGNNRLVHLDLDELECAYAFALMVPQSETERLLAEALQKQGMTIERELELTNFTQDADSITATLKRRDGSEESVTSNWLLGCDGAHSATRHILGLTFEGATYEEAFATADCYLDWNNPDDELFGYINEEGSLFFFPMGNRRYRLVADGPMHSPSDDLPLAEMQAIVDRRCPTKVTLSNPNWLTWFTINRRSASQYQNGRAFISGDAAHVHSPFLGQGMNTGMQDAVNLAWKIVLVEKGIAKPELLETYQTERHPIGQTLLRNTDAVTKLVTIRNPIAQQVRNRLMPLLASQEVVQQRASRTLSMLGLNYRNSSIVAEHREGLSHTLSHPLTDVPAWLEFAHGPAPGDRAPDGEVRLSGSTETVRLFEQLGGFTHHLLLFTGFQDSPKCANEIETALVEIQSKFAGFIRSQVVASNSAEAPNVPTLLIDVDGSLHHRYGASHSCLYLIRPDGYVGFRSQPIDVAQLQNYLERTGLLRVAQAVS